MQKLRVISSAVSSRVAEVADAQTENPKEKRGTSKAPTCDWCRLGPGCRRRPDGEVPAASDGLSQQAEPAADLGRHDVGHAERHAAEQLAAPVERRGRPSVSSARGWVTRQLARAE